MFCQIYCSLFILKRPAFWSFLALSCRSSALLVWQGKAKFLQHKVTASLLYTPPLQAKLFLFFCPRKSEVFFMALLKCGTQVSKITYKKWSIPREISRHWTILAKRGSFRIWFDYSRQIQVLCTLIRLQSSSPALSRKKKVLATKVWISINSHS